MIPFFIILAIALANIIVMARQPSTELGVDMDDTQHAGWR